MTENKNKSERLTFRQDLKKHRGLYVMMIPYMAFFIFFTVLPVAAAILLGFTSYNMFSAPEFVGLKNYVDLFVSDTVF